MYPDIVNNINGKIFSDNDGTNAYAPDDNGQFQLPLSISGGTALNEHGQIKSDSTFLDKAFFYQPVGRSDGIDDSGATPMFMSHLDTLLVENYAKGVDLVLEIEKNKELLQQEDEKNPCEKDCEDEKARLKGLIKDYEEQLKTLTNQGLVRSQLDDSIALLYGNGTTIGQVCSYAQALKEEVFKPVNPNDWCQGGIVSVNDANVCCSSDCMQCGGFKPASDGSCISGLCCTEGCCNDDFQEECKTVTSVGCIIPSTEIERLVDNIPGFCCLDAPYEADTWGETVSNQRIECIAKYLAIVF